MAFIFTTCGKKQILSRDTITLSSAFSLELKRF